MRCPFSLGTRQKTVREREREGEREMHRQLWGNGNPCRGRDGAIVSSEGFQRDEDRIRTPDDVRGGKSRG